MVVFYEFYRVVINSIIIFLHFCALAVGEIKNENLTYQTYRIKYSKLCDLFVDSG